MGKVRERLAVLACVTAHGVAPTAQRFGLALCVRMSETVPTLGIIVEGETG